MDDDAQVTLQTMFNNHKHELRKILFPTQDVVPPHHPHWRLYL